MLASIRGFRLALVVSLTLLALTQVACSPAARYGDEAVYSPERRGYVLTRETRHHRPLPDADVYVLQDPLRGTKLSCGEDVEALLPPTRAALAERTHNDNAELVSFGVLFPMAQAGAVLAYFGDILWQSALGPGHLATRSPLEHLKRGTKLLAEGHPREGRRDLELALFRDPSLAVSSPVLYQLAIAYARTGDDALSHRAMHAFVERSMASDRRAYEHAEAVLGAQGDAPAPCRSRAPVRVAWPR